MSRYLDADNDGNPDLALEGQVPVLASDPPPQTKWSPKVIVSIIAAFLAPAAYLTIGYLTTAEGQQIYSSLHPVLRVFIGGVISSAAVALAGYVKRDRLREYGARQLGARPKG